MPCLMKYQMRCGGDSLHQVYSHCHFIMQSLPSLYFFWTLHIEALFSFDFWHSSKFLLEMCHQGFEGRSSVYTANHIWKSEGSMPLQGRLLYVPSRWYKVPYPSCWRINLEWFVLPVSPLSGACDSRIPVSLTRHILRVEAAADEDAFAMTVERVVDEEAQKYIDEHGVHPDLMEFFKSNRFHAKDNLGQGDCLYYVSSYCQLLSIVWLCVLNLLHWYHFQCWLIAEYQDLSVRCSLTFASCKGGWCPHSGKSRLTQILIQWV